MTHFTWFPKRGYCRCTRQDTPKKTVAFLAVTGSITCDPGCAAIGGYEICVDSTAAPSGQFCSCVETCPPGYINVDTATTSGVGKCEVCQGKVHTKTSCSPCPNGHISLENSDECQNLQDTCQPSQCEACAGCIEQVAPQIAACSTVSSGNCYHPGTMWCTAYEELVKCQSSGLGCWFKLLCQSECVCDEWKAVFCGGDTDNQPCSSSLMQMVSPARNDSSRAQMSEGQVETESLEESLTFKRSC